MSHAASELASDDGGGGGTELEDRCARRDLARTQTEIARNGADLADVESEQGVLRELIVVMLRTADRVGQPTEDSPEDGERDRRHVGRVETEALRERCRALEPLLDVAEAEHFAELTRQPLPAPQLGPRVVALVLHS